MSKSASRDFPFGDEGNKQLLINLLFLPAWIQLIREELGTSGCDGFSDRVWNRFPGLSEEDKYQALKKIADYNGEYCWWSLREES